MEVIQTQEITKKFMEFTAVDNLSFTIHSGEIYGLLGHNGAGKTTALNMLIGLLTPTSGTASIMGHDIIKNPIEARKKMGMLPDKTGNYANLTARQNLQFYSELSGMTKNPEIEQLINLVGLEDWIDEKTGKYSRGMKRRLGIAQCLIRDPEILVLDEPTLGIDPEGTVMMRELIIKLAKEREKTVLVTTHLLSEVEKMCDKVGIMKNGKMVIEGTLDEIQEKTGKKARGLEEIFLWHQEVA